MYNLLDYGKMTADEGRVRAYLAALEKSLRPGDTVLDLGCGLGLFAMAACRLGAGRVIAVETNPWIEVARELARENGLAGRIEWHHRDASTLELGPEVDLVIADLRGVLPPAGQGLEVQREVREKFLRPDGRWIPERDVVFGTVVETPELHAPFVSPFGTEVAGFDFSAARRWSAHAWSRGRFGREAALADPGQLWETRYAQLTGPDCGGRPRFEINRAGTAHGLGVWFDTELAEGIGFSNAPWAEEHVYGSAFFPWPEPVELEAGDRVDVDLRAQLAGEEYVWSWSTSIRRQGHRIEEFQQSTFFGQPGLASLAKTAMGEGGPKE